MRADGLSSYWWKKLQADPDWQIAEYFYEQNSSSRVANQIVDWIPLFHFIAMAVAVSFVVRNQLASSTSESAKSQERKEGGI